MKPYIENRPWGKFEQFVLNEKCTVKILTVHPHEELSLQYHNNRDEFWKVIEGNPIVIIDKKEIKTKKDDEFFISKKMQHQLKGGKKIGKVLEISFGEFDEKDIIRIKDKYSRVI